MNNVEQIGRLSQEQLREEVLAWRLRFPQYTYRPQDDCVALKLEQHGRLAPSHADQVKP